MDAVSKCIECLNVVTYRQHGLECDGCARWQHRRCNTGVTAEQYRTAIRKEEDIVWQCKECLDVTPMDVTPIDLLTGTTDVDQSTPIGQQPSTAVACLGPMVEDEASIHEVNVDLTYEIFTESTKRQRELLVDPRGYRYSVKTRLQATVHWQCTSRPKVNPCKARVVQKLVSGDFVHGPQGHNHPSAPGTALVAKITKRVKETAAANVFQSAASIVNQVYLEDIGSAAVPTLPNPEQLARAANRHRQKLRPTDPTDLGFTLEEEFIPDNFLRGDVEVRGRRHLIFATDLQLRHLARATTWYIDGTFKLIREPFKQLMTIHAFVGEGSWIKQFPLVFVLKSGRKKKDYKKVLMKILEVLPEPASVESAMLDFEKATWAAIRDLLPDVSINGCSFHWTQAIWRKVADLGLSPAYQGDAGTYKFIGRLLALPYLPADNIPHQFYRLQLQATTPALQDLTNYIQATWVESNTWPPSTWSVYREAVRTNNDVEGWHNALNRRAHGKCNLPLYVLIRLLFDEAELSAMQIRLVHERKLRRTQRKVYRDIQEKIFASWDSFANDRNAQRLLRACTHMCAGPRE